jgi:hypothetical protein
MIKLNEKYWIHVKTYDYVYTYKYDKSDIALYVYKNNVYKNKSVTYHFMFNKYEDNGLDIFLIKR